MSFRVLRKLLQQNNQQPELPPPSSEDDDDFISDGDEDLVPGKNNFNAFALLIEPSSEHEGKDDIEVKPNETSEDADQPSSSKVNQKKKRKRKRKKKQKHTAANNNNNNDVNLTHDTKAKEENVNDTLATTTTIANCDETKKLSVLDQLDENLMKLELKHLNPKLELLKKFGKRVIKMDNNKRGRSKLMLKNTYLVNSQDRWPSLKKSTISMELVDPPSPREGTGNPKVQWFSFEHSDEYRRIQMMFFNALTQVNSDSIISLIRQSPYHVDSLIELSEVCKLSEDYALSAELIERALFFFESSLHPSFSLTSGNCRLDYRKQENRGFFVVLYKHAQYLEQRACTRTAFELSKLLFTLDPEDDPMAVILVIDYYAIRSKNYKWLVDFYKTHNAARNLSQLPNMAYSYAMAAYLVNGEEDTAEADKALQYALLMFPGLLCPLLEELSIPRTEVCTKHAYFTLAAIKQTEALLQLVDLYLCRAKVIWRQHNFRPWIEKNVKEVEDLLGKDKTLADQYYNKRQGRYRVPPRAVLRHVVLSDFKEKVPLAAFIADEKEPIQMYDPLPPLDADNLYERLKNSNMATNSSTVTSSNGSISMFFQSLLPSFNVNNATVARPMPVMVENPLRIIENRNNQQQQHQQQQQQQVRPQQQQHMNDTSGIEVIGEGNAVDRHLLSMDTFLDAVEETAIVRQSRGNIGDSTSYREFTQSINSFVDAMRDVLNFNVPEQLENNDDDLENLDVDSSDN